MWGRLSGASTTSHHRLLANNFEDTCTVPIPCSDDNDILSTADMSHILLLVFVLQLAIHLINKFGAQTINELLWTIYIKLPTPQSKDASDSARLRSEVVRLQREMGAVSAQDDFAKWARLRREHDKAKDKYEKQCTYTTTPTLSPLL